MFVSFFYEPRSRAADSVCSLSRLAPPVFRQRNNDRRHGGQSGHHGPARGRLRPGGSRSCRAGGILRSLQNPLDALAFRGLAFAAAAVVLFKQPFPGERLAGSEVVGLELGLYHGLTELLALAADVFAAVRDQNRQDPGHSGLIPAPLALLVNPAITPFM